MRVESREVSYETHTVGMREKERERYVQVIGGREGTKEQKETKETDKYGTKGACEKYCEMKNR